METALILYTQADNTPYLVDLYENENISLNYSFNDIKDLTPRGNYSRTFRIPFTETNAKIFGRQVQRTRRDDQTSVTASCKYARSQHG
jgi:hypothetical protein